LLLKFIMLEIGTQIGEANNQDIGTIRVPLVHDQCSYNRALQEAFMAMCSDKTFRYRTIFTTLEPMAWQKCAALQVADLLAYENFKESLRHRSTNPKDKARGRRIPLRELLTSDSFGGIAGHLDESVLISLKELIDERTSKVLDALDGNSRSLRF
jgi:hypothetical protein